MSTSQRDAVYEATLKALNDRGIAFQPGSTPIKSVATTEVRKAVLENLCDSFRAGSIALKNSPANQAKLGDAEKLKSYVSSLVSNHWARDPQLNGKGSSK
jgi:hypothetical protein